MAYVRILAIGNRAPEWINLAVNDYLKRFRYKFRVSIEGIPISSRSRNRFKDGTKNLLAKLSSDDFFVLLDAQGVQWSTKTLATNLTKWELGGKKLVFGIGGPDGWNEETFSRADSVWSLSKLTFPHMLVRVIVIEQLYRADMVRIFHPYHKIN